MLRHRIRTIERKARTQGVNVGGPRLFAQCHGDPSLVRAARARRCFAGSNNEIVQTWERRASESPDAFVDRVGAEAARACRHLPDGMVWVHFGPTLDACDSFYAFD